MGFAHVMREEVRALHRPRFGLLGVAVLLSLVALLAATVGASESARGFLLAAFGFVPCILLPIASMQIAGARSSRFLQGVFTSPITASHYLFAKFCLILLVGAAYLIAILPFLLVQAAHLGLRQEMGKYLLLGCGMVLYAACAGTLLGVLSTSRGSLAHLSVAVALMVGNLLALMLFEDLILLPNEGMAAIILRIFHLSGGVLLLDALSLTRLATAVSPLLSLLAFLTICAGSITAAWWIFSREQSPEGWEVGRWRAALVATLVVLVLLSPAALANADYEPVTRAGRPMDLGGNGLEIRIVPRGAPPPTSVHHISSGVLEAGRPNDVDILLFLYNGLDAPEPYTHFSIRFGGNDLTSSPGEVTLESPGTLPQASSRGPMHPPVPYLRVPVIITTPPPAELSKNHHGFSVNMSYQSASGEAITASSATSIDSEVSRAPLEMAAVGAPLPLVAAGAFAIRRWRMK